MIVVDASALLEVLLQTRAAPRVIDRLFRRGETLVAPHLIDVEVAQALRRYNANSELDGARAAEALRDLADLRLTRYAHDFLLPRVWGLRHNVTAYDAVYVALAEVMEVPLITRDARLAAAPGHGAVIELL